MRGVGGFSRPNEINGLRRSLHLCSGILYFALQNAKRTIAMTATTVPMSIRLDVSARERLKAIAVRQKRSPHALATEAIHQLIEQKEREHAWHQSCDDALKHFDDTGLHATHEEVMKWMDSLAADKDAPPPECHL